MKYPRFTGSEPCAQIGMENFFLDPSHYSIWAGKHLRPICDGCPMQQQCLDWGMEHEEHGWWGGYSPRERAVLRKEMGVTLKPIPVSEWLGVS